MMRSAMLSAEMPGQVSSAVRCIFSKVFSVVVISEGRKPNCTALRSSCSVVRIASGQRVGMVESETLKPYTVLNIGL